MSVNPKGLSTFTGIIETEQALISVMDVSAGRKPTGTLPAMISKITAAGHTVVGSDDDRAVFSVFPGLGSASIEDAGQEDGHTLWDVIITHPAMDQCKGEVHLCDNTEQILAVLSTVSYG